MFSQRIKTQSAQQVDVEKKVRSEWPSLGWLLTLAPIVGYFIAFQHEVTYCGFFGIPNDFISIGWATLIIDISNVIGICLVLMFLANSPIIFRMLGYSYSGPYERRIFREIITLITILLIFVQFHTNVPHFQYFFLFQAYPLIEDFLIPTFTHVETHKYLDKLKAVDETYKKSYEKITASGAKMLVIAMELILAISFLFIFTRIDAVNQAEKQQTFLVTSDTGQFNNSRSVVLRVYGDNLICASFDRQTKQLDEGFFVLQMGQNPNLKLASENIGPLTRYVATIPNP